MPRIAFTENMFCAMRGLVPLGIPVAKSSGPYWHQDLARMMDAKVSTASKYILTIDYDTAFSPDDVRELHRLMEANPKIGAIASVQMMKGDAKVLIVPLDDNGDVFNPVPQHFNKELLPCKSAHFGMTMMRVESLKKMPKPWFVAKPAPDGGWGDGRKDADVVFWNTWHEEGLGLYVASRVVVGHLQLMVTWPSKLLRPVFQFANHYGESGKPEVAL